jgi:tyrosyl-tRNA synthetase
VEKLLLHLTLISVSNIRTIVSDHVAEPHQRIAQRTLARAVCTAVHGADATQRAEVSSIALFRGDSLEVSVALLCTF